MATDYYALFIDYLTIERGLSKQTIISYSAILRTFKEFLAAQSTEVREAGENEVRAYIRTLSEQGKSSASIAQVTSALRTFYTFLIDEGLLEKHPLQKIHSVKQASRIPKILTTEQVQKLLDEIKTAKSIGLRDFLIFSILFTTGLRVSELCDITFNQLNQSMHSIRVIGKGSKERQVLYPEALDAIFSAYLAEFKEIHHQSKHSNLLFLTPQGAKLTRQLIYQRLQYYRRNAGISQRLSPHMLRHAFATHLLANGADIRSVQELLGHQSIATTQVYLDVPSQSIRDTYLTLHAHKKGEKSNGKV